MTAARDANDAIRAALGSRPTQGTEVHVCEVDVFEGFGPCDRPGVVIYEDTPRDMVMLCLGHAYELGADVEFGPESDG